MKYINKFENNDVINGIYMVKNKSIGVAKNNKEYFSLSLQDKTGSIDAKIWDTNSPYIENFESGNFVEISGSVNLYNNIKQLKIERLRVAKEDEYNSDDFFVVSKYDKNDMTKELDSIISKIKNNNYKKVLNMIFVEDKIFREKFLSHQGGKNVHHSFVNGLLEHTLSVTKVAISIAKNYKNVNVDLVAASSLLHDIGKVYEISDYPENDYTDSGHLIGHIILGYDMVKNAIDKVGNFKEKEKNELLHCILSHHGSLEFGSPKLPSLIESYIVASADNLDAKIAIITEGIESMKQGAKDDYSFSSFNKYLGTSFRETLREEDL